MKICEHELMDSVELGVFPPHLNPLLKEEEAIIPLLLLGEG